MDILAVIVSLILFGLIVGAIYWFFLKPSGDKVSSNFVTIQQSIDTLTASLSSSDGNIKDITSTVIPALQKTINTSIDEIAEKLKSLTSSTDAKNVFFTSLIDDLKSANDSLSKSTTLSTENLKSLINSLTTTFENFSKQQGESIKNLTDTQKADLVKVYAAIETGLKSKDVSISTLQRNIEKSIEVLTKTVTDKNTQFDTMISNLKEANDALSKSTTVTTDSLKSLMNSLKKAFDDFSKEQGDTIKTLTETQKSDLVKVYAAIDTGLKSRDVSISTLQKNLEKSIEVLTKIVTDKNAQFDIMISNLKEADEILSKSTTKSLTNLQTKLDTLQLAFDTFVKTQASEIKRIDDKGKSDYDALNNKMDAMQKKIDDKVKAEFDTLNSKLATMGTRISDNDSLDAKYNNYVDTINAYIDNAMAIPEIADRVKERIFNTARKNYEIKENKDELQEYFKLKTREEKSLYVLNKYNSFNICTTDKKELQLEDLGRLFSVILMGSSVNEKIYEFLWLFTVHNMFPKDMYYEDGELISKTGITENIKTELNRPLAILGIPLITNLNAYGYLNAKKAVIMSYRNTLFNCNDWSSKIGESLSGPIKQNGRSDMCNFFEKIKTDKCPDLAMQFLNLKTIDEQKQFKNNIFNKITGCDYQGENIDQNPEKIFSMIQKNGANGNNEELYEFIWLTLFSMYSKNKQNIMYDVDAKEFKRNYNSIQNEDAKKRAMDNDKKQETAFNLFLVSIGLPPIVDGKYSYANAKVGVIKALKMGFFDCETMATVVSSVVDKKDVCAIRDRKFPDTCPVYVIPKPMEEVAKTVPQVVTTEAKSAASSTLATSTENLQAKLKADKETAEAMKMNNNIEAKLKAVPVSSGGGVELAAKLKADMEASQASIAATNLAASNAATAIGAAKLEEMKKAQAAQDAKIKAEITALQAAVANPPVVIKNSLATVDLAAKLKADMEASQASIAVAKKA